MASCCQSTTVEDTTAQDAGCCSTSTAATGAGTECCSTSSPAH